MQLLLLVKMSYVLSSFRARKIIKWPAAFTLVVMKYKFTKAKHSESRMQSEKFLNVSWVGPSVQLSVASHNIWYIRKILRITAFFLR